MSPPSEDQYDVYPVHLGDAASMNEKFVSWLFRFNDVLDVDKLHLALARLLERGDWRKLGGRLHRTVRSPFNVCQREVMLIMQ